MYRRSLGFTQFVTSLNAKVRSGPGVSLWPGWIVQLIHTSLTWRSHVVFSLLYQLYQPNHSLGPIVAHAVCSQCVQCNAIPGYQD